MVMGMMPGAAQVPQLCMMLSQAAELSVSAAMCYSCGAAAMSGDDRCTFCKGTAAAAGIVVGGMPKAAQVP